MDRENPFVRPLVIPVRPSRWVAAGLLAVHGGALWPLMQTSLPGWVQALLVIVIVISLALTLRNHVIPGPDQPRLLQLDGQGAWLLTDGLGITRTVRLRNDALVHPALIALRLCAGRRCWRVLLTTDNADADTLRRLRVRLKNPVNS